MEIILASASPRRSALLQLLGLPFTALPTGEDETLPLGLPPAEAVQALALRKAQAAVRQHPQALVIGADTAVVADGEILGKPADRAGAARMLRMLSGRAHQVYTGVALLCPKGQQIFHQCTGVTFYPLSERTIEWYLDTGEPFDKAGAYGIQGKGALLVREIAGDYLNVVGLPLALTARKIGALLEKDPFLD